MKFIYSVLLLLFSFHSLAEVNLRTSPIHLLAGIALFEADFKINDKWSLGPTLAYSSADQDGFETNVYALGVRGNYYFAGTFAQGWYMSPGVQFVSASVKDDDPTFGEIEGKASGFAINLFGGYFWMWENFNIQLGAGPVIYTLGEITVENKSSNYKEDFGGNNGVDLGIEFSLGWKF